MFQNSPLLAWVLAFGDLIVLLFFSFAGRHTHAESTNFLSIVATSLPFLIGWFASGLLFQSFSVQAVRTPGRAVLKVLIAWPIGGICGLLLRAFYLNHAIQAPFVIVVLLFNFLFLSIWRIAVSIYIQRARPSH